MFEEAFEVMRRKRMIIALLALAVIAFVGRVLLFAYLQEFRPVVSITNLGRVIQVKNHGHKFYVTIQESRLLDWLSYGTIPLFLLAAWLFQRWQIFKGRAPGRH